ncbi:transposase [Halococcus sp. PRR34]|uniref:RNA-guided endonuclease InsQ/TnpB family protein n=1 Tax=Halococcus sp. PRR34 TaxID=3020830 RepID=UPI0023609EAB|nr:transposase [Halococcus sp. PRR34]
MAIKTVIRTHRASIRNQRQVRDGLDTLGFAAAKLWNVARWTAGRVWNACGQIPDDGALKSYLKSHERYADLNAQSSQRVLEELDEAFTGWYGHRRNGNEKANPPGYRKHNGEHPRATVTFKEDGFKHDSKNGYIRLSKGRNTKAHWSDFILCAYDADPDVAIENVQQVRSVYEHSEWRLHIVCKHEIETEPPGDRTAGVDLGICNVAAVSFGDESLLYPGGALKEDEYHFAKKRAECDDSASRNARRLDRKRSERRTHFYHALSKAIIAECVERRVGTLVVGDLAGIRDDEDGTPKNWGPHGNLDLHGWPFDSLPSALEYKGEAEGIDVLRKDERDTSKSCSACGRKRKANRQERGLYVCDECGLVANADTNGAENIRQKVPPNPPAREDRSNGWMAQPAVHLFDRREGVFAPREQVTKTNREP